jgi:cyclophilin family peptidyl-prolyl cis-trans isomerase
VHRMATIGTRRSGATIAAVLASALVLSGCGGLGAGSSPTRPPAAPTTAATRTSAASASGAAAACVKGPQKPIAAPEATPLANPPADVASDGTTATIKTSLGDITIELFTKSAPVAATNFIDLAESGFYDCVVFHRLVPGFVIQGGDPLGTGGGGPGYTIQDEKVVGKYQRGVVAMARTPRPNSQGSQFFIVLDDGARKALDSARTYVIFGRVTAGMDVVDKIALMPTDGGPNDAALDPLPMLTVTVKRP